LRLSIGRCRIDVSGDFSTPFTPPSGRFTAFTVTGAYGTAGEVIPSS
jgi:hypothetical protein